MKNEVIIDGCNVAECQYFNKVVNEEPYCNIDEEHLYTCSSDENCYYKQLQRAKAELEQYKKSKQASYEVMQKEWNNAVNELRDIKTKNEKLKAELDKYKRID